jgi:hypothetical protein
MVAAGREPGQGGHCVILTVGLGHHHIHPICEPNDRNTAQAGWLRAPGEGGGILRMYREGHGEVGYVH